MKTVVLGGSFNPPTVGHLELLRAAKEAVGAELALFVPSSYAYVSCKLSRSGEKSEALSDEVRISMLREMCRGLCGFEVEEYEVTKVGKAYTFETLEYIEQKYGSCEVYFIAGSDKLSVFPRWHRARELFTRFRILAASRDGDNARALIDGDRFLSEYSKNFTVFYPPEGIGDISSSGVRKMMREGRREEAKSCLHPTVYRQLCEIYGIHE